MTKQRQTYIKQMINNDKHDKHRNDKQCQNMRNIVKQMAKQKDKKRRHIKY